MGSDDRLRKERLTFRSNLAISPPNLPVAFRETSVRVCPRQTGGVAAFFSVVFFMNLSFFINRRGERKYIPLSSSSQLIVRAGPSYAAHPVDFRDPGDGLHGHSIQNRDEAGRCGHFITHNCPRVMRRQFAEAATALDIGWDVCDRRAGRD